MTDLASADSCAVQRSKSLFQVYLRLRPPTPGASPAPRFITTEPPAPDAPSAAVTHITLNPPNDRRRAVEKFAFTQVFDQDATQLDIFHCTNIVPLVEGILAPHGGEGTDALLATLGVTGSGKSHTILGSRTQRGLTQLSLDLLFRSIGRNIADVDTNNIVETSIKSSDASEATISTASAFIESTYGESSGRAPTPQTVRDHNVPAVVDIQHSDLLFPGLPQLMEEPGHLVSTPKSVRIVRKEDYTAYSPSSPDGLGRHMLVSSHGNAPSTTVRRQPLQARAGNVNTPSKSLSKNYMSVTASAKQRNRITNTTIKGDQPMQQTPRRHLNRPSAPPQVPDISAISVSADPIAEYVVLISMYEVYNDRIFDLLTPPVKSAATKEFRRRPLLFKSTELSPDRKVVAGLRKIICTDINQAIMVLEAGLHERSVAGTGSNSVSSRSHGFFSIEVKKRKRSISKRHQYPWRGNALTIVDLAGSERARDAKTTGATLAEAGKINESLMYLGQCLQMQSDLGSGNKQPSAVPFRQCKLTELLFSNSFPSPSSLSQPQSARRNPQKAVMIVTADASGDYNATSQILRYSALAREVTVPRIPSITETILAANSSSAHSRTTSSCSSSSPTMPPTIELQQPVLSLPYRIPNFPRNLSPISTPTSDDRATMEHAALEIARLSEETKNLRESLAHEKEARAAAEEHLLSMDEKMLHLEQVVREDCVAEFEQRLAVELARWKTGLQMAIERGEEHWDRKMEVFQRSLASQVSVEETTNDAEDDTGDDKENVLVESLEEENARLRCELAILKRELSGRTPSKRVPLMERDDFSPMTHGSPRTARSRTASRNLQDGIMQGEILQRRMESLTLRSYDENRSIPTVGNRSTSAKRTNNRSQADGSGSPTKRARKLVARKWEGGLELGDPFGPVLEI